MVRRKSFKSLHWTSTTTSFSLVAVPTWLVNSQEYAPRSSLVAFFTSNACCSGFPPSKRDWFKLSTELFCSHRTLAREAGFASYSQKRRNSPVSFIVKLSGLTITTGGSGVGKRKAKEKSKQKNWFRMFSCFSSSSSSSLVAWEFFASYFINFLI